MPLVNFFKGVLTLVDTSPILGSRNPLLVDSTSNIASALMDLGFSPIFNCEKTEGQLPSIPTSSSNK
jgi:hypothetical protein